MARLDFEAFQVMRKTPSLIKPIAVEEVKNRDSAIKKTVIALIEHGRLSSAEVAEAASISYPAASKATAELFRMKLANKIKLKKSDDTSKREYFTLVSDKITADNFLDFNSTTPIGLVRSALSVVDGNETTAIAKKIGMSNSTVLRALNTLIDNGDATIAPSKTKKGKFFDYYLVDKND